MFKIESGLDYEDLTEEEQREAPNNGPGKDMASYIRITDNQGSRVYSDAMEPEDSSFHRDLSWIASELKHAYIVGKSDICMGTY